MKIRFATIKDAPELLKIYEQYIDTPITFEEKSRHYMNMSNALITLLDDTHI